MTAEKRAGFQITDATAITAREDEGRVVPIYDPRTDAPVATITVVGTYSSRFRKAEQDLTDRLMRERQTAKSTAEQRDQKSCEIIAACILSWDGFMDGDRPYDFSTEHAVALLVRAPFIREQLEAAMRDHAGFFGSSSAS